jgi:hypothetical protein
LPVGAALLCAFYPVSQTIPALSYCRPQCPIHEFHLLLFIGRLISLIWLKLCNFFLFFFQYTKGIQKGDTVAQSFLSYILCPSLFDYASVPEKRWRPRSAQGRPWARGNGGATGLVTRCGRCYRKLYSCTCTKLQWVGCTLWALFTFSVKTAGSTCLRPVVHLNGAAAPGDP